MRIKPTLRKDGALRTTHTIKVHIGFEDIVNAIMDHVCLRQEKLPNTRVDAVKLAIRHAVEYGLSAWAVVEQLDYTDKECVVCIEHAIKLFPEMAEKFDFKTAWGYERKAKER
jgi:hypothetical protein